MNEPQPNFNERLEQERQQAALAAVNAISSETKSYIPFSDPYESGVFHYMHFTLDLSELVEGMTV